jgi:hypothetical protein
MLEAGGVATHLGLELPAHLPRRQHAHDDGEARQDHEGQRR